MRKSLLIGAILTLPAAPQVAPAAGTPGAGAEEVPDGQSARDTAAAHYQTGLRHKAAALEKEQAAVEATAAETRQRLQLEASAQFEQAATAYGRALKLSLQHYEAANELGYALRKSGQYRKALGAYNFALVIKPDFYHAIEYRGEAYLALGMLDEAREAYMTLFRNDLALAARLLEAMAESGPDGEFAIWVAERQAIASVTPHGRALAERDW